MVRGPRQRDQGNRTGASKTQNAASRNFAQSALPKPINTQLSKAWGKSITKPRRTGAAQCETMKSIMQDDRKPGAFRNIRSGAYASQIAAREGKKKRASAQVDCATGRFVHCVPRGTGRHRSPQPEDPSGRRENFFGQMNANVEPDVEYVSVGRARVEAQQP